ncbi:hypothetical protein ElyMa_006811500 [Elysia marginata]|uniref:Uncharacterized protein n=1 Tax=Elysia marginata TaxID=1093978 RepID=A0AAV4J7U8_9GAST|nr:hypothetical protein ElyMa_006811500 [Elysia marginata]
MVSPMYLRGYRAAFLRCLALTAVIVTVAGSGCQHSCDCGFASDGNDKDVTLRYEVMSGLVGAFAPLTVAGLSFLTYKLCSRPPTGAASLPAGGGAPPMATQYGGWRGGPPGAGNRGHNNLDGGEPTSLYGESDDEMPSERDNRRGLPGGRGVRPNSQNSRYTNIHRNVKTDMTNQWLRNVNLRKY